MKPHSIGRVLGIGLRVAGRMAGQKLSASSATASSRPSSAAVSPESLRSAGRSAGVASRGMARGVAGFLRPFRRVGGIIWLEVAGVFFFLPVVAFAPALWRTRPHSLHGPYDKTFLVSVAVMVVFLYLGVSSFWRARKR